MRINRRIPLGGNFNCSFIKKTLFYWSPQLNPILFNPNDDFLMHHLGLRFKREFVAKTHINETKTLFYYRLRGLHCEPSL